MTIDFFQEKFKAEAEEVCNGEGDKETVKA